MVPNIVDTDSINYIWSTVSGRIECNSVNKNFLKKTMAIYDYNQSPLWL